MYSVLNCHNVTEHTEFYSDSYGSMWLPLVMRSISKRALQPESSYTFIQNMYSVLNCHNVTEHTEFYSDSYGSMWLPLVMQGVSKRVLQPESLYKFFQRTCTVF
jgi:uncharacterized protein YgiB involved in biofilm formation